MAPLPRSSATGAPPLPTPNGGVAHPGAPAPRPRSFFTTPPCVPAALRHLSLVRDVVTSVRPQPADWRVGSGGAFGQNQGARGDGQSYQGLAEIVDDVSGDRRAPRHSNLDVVGDRPFGNVDRRSAIEGPARAQSRRRISRFGGG